MKITGMVNTITKNQSFKSSGTVPNTLANTGTYNITQCNKKLENTAYHRYMLLKNPIVTRLEFSDIAFNAFNISIITNTVKAKVAGFFFPYMKYSQGLSWFSKTLS